MNTGFSKPKPKIDTSLLPHSLEAEQAVLGAILVDADALHRVVEYIEKSSFFYKRSHQLIYESFLALFNKNENIDTLTASQHLKDQGTLDEVGGRTYLSALTDHAPIAANAPHYAKIIQSKALLRGMILAGNEIVELGYHAEEDPDILVDKAEQLIFDLSQTKSREQLIHIGDLVHKSWQLLEEREANKNQLSGINTGFYDLNTLTSGLQKSDLLILAARPAMGKCLHKDSEIVLEDGSLVTIEQIYKSKDAKLLTLNSDWKLSFTRPCDFIDDGVKPLFEIITKTGRSIKTTLTHPYLTIMGWKKLEELEPGVKVAVPRIIKVFGQKQIRDCEAKLLGYLIGDGSLTESSIGFTNNNLKIQEDFIAAVLEFDSSLKTQKINDETRADSFRVSKNHEFLVEQRILFAYKLKQIVNSKNISYREIAIQLNVSPALVTLWHQGAVAPDESCFSRLCELLNTDEAELAPNGLSGISKNQKSSLAIWLEQMGLQGKNSHQKEIPEMVFKLTKQQIALLINRLFSTDGWATVLSSGQSQLGYASVSEKLIRQVQHLLLRFGIISSIRQKTVEYKDSNHFSWQLNITDQDSIKTFINEIGIFGKEDALTKVSEATSGKKSHTNKDLIPIEVWSLIEQMKGSESWSSLASRAGFKSTTNIHPHKRSISRKRLSAIAHALNHQELNDIANSDVYWDEIVSIKHLGFDQVYDLTIPDTHNFVANDICVHNTSLALNIAENVAVKYKHPVAIFSLEMSKEQLVQRLLCSRAEVDSSRVRSGQLHAEDWAKLGTAMSDLGEAPIYIDDSAGVSVMELRGKCRRLQAQCGGKLGLVIVDYLQLLEGRSNDTRINQISEISRGLKMMARELDVPVMALSQLSRAVEARQDKRPMLSDLRESGCLTADTLIYNPETGDYNPIKDLLNKENFPVYALDEKQKLISVKAKKAFYSGRKKIYKVTTFSGNEVKASANHPFLTDSGWKALEELQVNDYVATARVLKSNADDFNLIKVTSRQKDVSHREFQNQLSTQYCGNTLLKEKIDSQELEQTACSDISWDKIKSIELIGEEDVYDIEVPIYHNFVAENFILHNSLEQDADIVLFIYRDDYYNPESEKAGIADVIISKHRSGPVGVVELLFQNNITKFKNPLQQG